MSADVSSAASPGSARGAGRSGIVTRIGQAPLTVLRAPAGFGKSTVMRAHRAGSAARRSAWVSFDGIRPARADQMRALLVDAATTLGIPGAGTLATLGPSPDRSLGEEFVDALAETLLSLDEPWTLYLDDLHRLGTALTEEIGELLTRLDPEHTGSPGRIVIGTRTSPPWPMSRWQLTGRLTLIGPDELRLDAEATRHLLGDDHERHANEVVDATTGWPAAVATVCSLVTGSGSAPAEHMTETLDAFVREEVLADLDPSDLTLLTCLRVAATAPAEVIATVCGESDVVTRLRRLVRETALVIEDDHERFTLHPLLARAIDERLQRLGPHELRALHERAAEAWAEVPETIEGITRIVTHLTAAGDPAAALEHLRRRWERFFDAGRLDLVIELIEAVPSRHWRTDTGLSLLLGWSHTLLGHETRAQEVFHSTSLGDDPAGSAIWKIIRAQSTWWTVNPAEALALIDAGRRELELLTDDALPDVPGHRSVRAFRMVADIAELRALLLSGRLAEAETVGHRVQVTLWDLEPLAMASVAAMRALVAALRGDTDEARSLIDETYRREADLDGDRLFAAPAHLAEAAVHLLGGDTEAARPQLARVASIARSHRAHHLVRLTQLVASLAGGEGDRCEALGGELVAAHASLPYVEQILTARRAVDRCRLGDLEGAEQLLSTTRPDELTVAQWAEVLVTVRSRREAARLVAAQPPATGPAGTIVRAMADAACMPASADARPLTRRAIELAAQHRLRGLLLDGPEMVFDRPEIAALDDRQLRQLLDERAARRADEDRPRLTRRELEVLERTARSETAGEIAARMYLSVNTVKWHRANIYRKLGVDGSSAAIARAAELGLLGGER